LSIYDVGTGAAALVWGGAALAFGAWVAAGNAGVMVGLMMPGVSDDVLSDICKIVMAEKCRRAAAAAA
jgi:hypothetical protein